MPDAERASRKADLRTLLGEGMALRNELEPSDALIDAAVEIYETEQIKRIAWERCTSKTDEAESEKVVRELQIGKDGLVRLNAAPSDATADASTLMKLNDALIRRGAALHIAGVLSWRKHQALAAEMLSALKAEPPTGMSRPSMTQVRAFDQEVWRRVAELAEGRVKSLGDSSRPLDDIVSRVLIEPRVAMLLLPRPGGGSAASSDPEGGRVHRLEAQLADLKRKMAQGGGGGSKGSGKRHGKNEGNKKARSDKGSGKGCRIPGLLGMPYKQDGRQVCFGYNLGTCTAAAPGKQCSKGLHVCGGCGSPSCSWPDCPKK